MISSASSIARWLRRLRLIGVSVALSGLGIAACGASSHAGCLKVPRSIPQSELLTTGTKLSVPVGRTVYVVLVQYEALAGPGFPWKTPRSSNRTVLKSVRLCRQTGESSLPVMVTGFSALHAGVATIKASLSPAWRAQKDRPKPAVDHVNVLRRRS